MVECNGWLNSTGAYSAQLEYDGGKVCGSVEIPDQSGGYSTWEFNFLLDDFLNFADEVRKMREEGEK